MSSSLSDILALINDVLQAIIVIFGTAVVLYNTNRLRRANVTRAFCALITFVVIVYLTELMVSRILVTDSAETWLRVGWVGLALVPAAQFHLSSALLATTGALPRRRRWLVPLGYLSGFVFMGLALGTDLLVTGLVRLPHSLRLTAGPLFLPFGFFFWVVTVSSIYNVWRARRRCLTSTTRKRMTYTLIAFLAAPLGVFPYLMLAGNAGQDVPLFLWPILILGNMVVSVMFGILTSQLVYFGSLSPDRVVRVRLFKFMARVPLAGTIVLLVYILINRRESFLGLPSQVALGFALVATVMLVEWAVHAYKQAFERIFQLNDNPDVRRIQMLSERLLTTSDLRQFLESVLAATCEAIRTPTAFVAAVTAEGPKLESVVGPLAEPDVMLQDADLRKLARANGSNDAEELETVDDFIVWQNYWIRPLLNRQKNLVLGIFGVRARAEAPDLTPAEQEILNRLIKQAAGALEDRILQQEVFAAVEGLLPEITALQERRSAATFGGLPVLTADKATAKDITADPDFIAMVRDALSHYWGGPKLTESPLMRLRVVQEALETHENNPVNALRAILAQAIELQKPEGQRNLTTGEWILYNILELKFVQGRRVRDVARRLAMSESDLYRKQRVAIENVARAIAKLEQATVDEALATPDTVETAD
jgi:GAF domain-containing protein